MACMTLPTDVRPVSCLIIMPDKSKKHAEEGAAEDLEPKVDKESTDSGEATEDEGSTNR